MQRLAISMACAALVLGLSVADADTPPDTPSHQTASKRSRGEKVANQAQGPDKGTSAVEPAQQKRSARARLPALRERRLQNLGRERSEPTAEEFLAKELEEVWSGRYLRRGTTAVYVVDTATGRPVYAHHEDERLNPASNVKLIATATILDVLGPDWRYLTRILGPTPTPEGVIKGDMYLLGSYDPTLGAEDIEGMAERIAATGVTRIEGNIYVGEGMRGDDLRRDSVRRPRVTIRVKGASSAGSEPDVTITPETGFVHVVSHVKTIRRTRNKRRAKIKVDTRIIEDPEIGTYWQVELSGYVQVGRRATYRRVVPRGQLYTAHLLQKALVEASVTVTGIPRQASLPDYVADATSYLPVEIARHESIPMAELIAKINKRSINYLADRAIMTAGAVRFGGPPTMEKGVRAMYEWLRDNAEINPDNLVLDTGSGLSYKTQLTARQIVKVLRVAGGFAHAGHGDDGHERDENDDGDDSAQLGTAEPTLVANLQIGTSPGDDEGGDEISELSDAPPPDAETDGDPDLDEGASQLEEVFRESLAVAGVDGTLRRRFRHSKARGKVMGKTGTLTRVIALSGIVEQDGQALAFSIITNGHQHRRRRNVRKEHEAMVEAMQRFLRARAKKSNE